jgi:hypothetical protein
MRSRSLSRLVLLLPLLLSACGDLPEPFLGNPGATARRLAVPATPMLVVPPPTRALLTGASIDDFADLLALSLQKEDVPSLARVPRKGDWRLAVTAERKGEQIVPRYAIEDPSGKELGSIDGAAFPAPGWTAGSPSILGQAARDAVPKVVALMLSIRATRDRANPNSLLNRPAKLFVPEVTGAPGDGNVVLTRMMRARLVEFGPLVQVTPEAADFTVTGHVIVTPIPKAQQRVEIVWTVTRASGVVNGKVSQLNNVPAGTLDSYWGDIAAVVTQEASGGVNEVVERFIGRDNPEGLKSATGTPTTPRSPQPNPEPPSAPAVKPAPVPAPAPAAKPAPVPASAPATKPAPAPAAKPKQKPKPKPKPSATAE